MKASSVFEYGAMTERNWELNLAEMTDYIRKYTFYSDFGLAEWSEIYAGDKGGVKKTFEEVIKSWKSNYEALTEIVLVLNHKSWAFAGYVDSAMLGCSKAQADAFKSLYIDLYYKADEIFRATYKDNEEAMDYYYSVTD